ncbi:MAG: PH domain-containing protein [Faecalibacterium sp.]
MNERRLHPFTVLRFLRKTLVVYLLPLVQVLFERNWTALHTALRQDALLFLLLCAVSWGILRVSSWSLDDTGVFHLHWRLGIRLDRALRGEMLAALTIDRPLLYRMAGASRLTLYPVGAAQKHTLSVCLPKADAEAVADQLMPLVKPTLHRPAGGERAALGFLGANGLSTLALFVLAVRQTRDVPDWNPAVFAQIQVSFLARFAARWLPAGAAWLLAAAGFLLGASLMRSFAQTVHYTVWHTARPDRQPGRLAGALRVPGADKRDQLCRCPHLPRRLADETLAGLCNGGRLLPELPLFVYRSGEEALFRELLPEFRMPPDLLARTEQRSLIFFAPAGIPFALCLLLTLVSATVLPQLTVTLLIPTLFFGALLAGAAAGYRREGLWLREGRMTLRRQQGLYLHCICVFHPDVCLTAAQSPWAASVGRTNLTLTFPGWVKLKVRSVPLRDAEKFFRFMETN